MEWNKNRVVEAVIIGIIVAIIILIQQHFTLNKFVFVCNDNKCVITHYNQQGRKMKEQTFDINNMKGFEYRLEKRKRNFFEFKSQRRSNRQVYYIYINYYDGSSYKLSPLFVRKDALYYAIKIVNELNNELKIKNINYTFE